MSSKISSIVFDVKVANFDDIRSLYNQSALTWEGLDFSEDSRKALSEWLVDENLSNSDKLDVYTWRGATMNSLYNLTGDNRYPSDLTFVSIPLDNLNVAKLAVKRLEVGGRWLDDIVDNNQRREIGKY